ncbi:DNA cytosine methyltransferase [Xenorhabdus khoisanae]|uniref:DNA cytosine methyltransferase n=1 Tax=Xenorhabdus khoisanae TaxID=880157 RepID=UPI002358C7DC|nr:DNA cytosine methyltransferase [Xenorhabdus khoisanae]MDC9616228.1 DNA cytosine methyltransferase [Xenorhabdus khoisanae]
MNDVITVTEASQLLKLTPQRVRAMCKQGDLQAYQSGKTWLIRTESVQQKMLINNDTNQTIRSSKAEHRNKPKALSFFSGAMGLDLGIEKAGFDTLLACEIDKAARDTILTNKPDIALIGDIRDYTSQEILNLAGLNSDDDIDLIIGGPPCQAFSTAGKRLGLEDERGNVFIKFLDVALEIKPKYIVIENVRGLLSAPLKHRPHVQRGKDLPPLETEEQPGGVLRYIIRIIRSAGYSVSFNLYNSANFGVPQIRERIIIICSRDGNRVPFLQPTHSEEGDFGLPKWITLREAIEGLSNVSHEHIDFPEKRLKYYRILKSGQHWKHLPEDLQKEALGKSFYLSGGKTGFLRRVAWDRPSPTLVTHPAMPATDLAHPEELRPLSIQEYKAIQQFPERWIIKGKLLDKYRQLGNAVPIGLGYAVGKNILDHMNGNKIDVIPNFKYSRYKKTSDIDIFGEII